MEHKCILGKMKEINYICCKFISNKIKKEGIAILHNHIPLFYILPEDGEGLIFTEILNIWKISKSSLSDIINKYENQGLIRKSVSAEDKRSIYVSLTPEAIKIKKKLLNIEAEVLDSMLMDFDINERQILEKNINKALNNLKKQFKQYK